MQKFYKFVNEHTILEAPFLVGGVAGFNKLGAEALGKHGYFPLIKTEKELKPNERIVYELRGNVIVEEIAVNENHKAEELAKWLAVNTNRILLAVLEGGLDNSNEFEKLLFEYKSLKEGI